MSNRIIKRIDSDEEVVTIKYILFIYFLISIPSIILLISCLVYIHKSQIIRTTVLIIFGSLGILLSFFDVAMVILPMYRFIENKYNNNSISFNRDYIITTLLFILIGSLIFTCSVLVIYFSKINLDAEDTRQTLIACVVCIVVFTILQCLVVLYQLTHMNEDVKLYDKKLEKIKNDDDDDDHINILIFSASLLNILMFSIIFLLLSRRTEYNM